MDEELKLKLSLDLTKAKIQIKEIKKDLEINMGGDDYKNATSALKGYLKDLKASTDYLAIASQAAKDVDKNMLALEKNSKKVERAIKSVKQDMEEIDIINEAGDLAKVETEWGRIVSNIKEYTVMYKQVANGTPLSAFGEGSDMESSKRILQDTFEEIKDSLNGLDIKSSVKEKIINNIKGMTDAMDKGKISAEELDAALEKMGKGGSQNINSLTKTMSQFREFLSKVLIPVLVIRKVFSSLENIKINELVDGKAKEDIKQLQANLNRMKQDLASLGVALANTFGPVIDTLVKGIDYIANAIRKLLSAIGLVSFKDTEKHLSSSAKTLSKMKREAMGFDELNILPGADSGSSGSGTDLDTSKLLGEQGTWKDALDTILGGALVAVGLKWGPEFIKSLFSGEDVDWENLLKMGGIILFFEGLKLTIEGVIGLFENDAFSPEWWDSFGKTLIGIGLAVAAVMILIGVSNPVGFIITAVVLLVGLIIKYRDEIWDAIKAAWEWITNLFSDAWSWFKEKVCDPVKNKFSDVWNNLKDGAKNAWEGIKKVFSTITDWFKNTFKKAWEGVKDVFSTGGKIFSGIKEGIENTFKTVVNGIIQGINKIIKVPFNTINNMFKKLKNIEILGLKPFNWLTTFSVPQIPQLATGGITTGSTLANIGEAGREAVLPLENNTEWMDVLADRIASRAQQKVVLNVDGRQLGMATISSINGITAETGSLPLKVF